MADAPGLGSGPERGGGSSPSWVTMNCTINGCTCHMLHAGQECIACRGRTKAAQEGRKCKKCQIGVWTKNGDSEEKQGLCTQCYYDD